MTTLSLGLIAMLLLWTPDIQCDDTEETQLNADMKNFIQSQSNDLKRMIDNHDGTILVSFNNMRLELADIDRTINNFVALINQTEIDTRLSKLEAMQQLVTRKQMHNTQSETKKALENVMEAIQGVTAAITSMNGNVVDIVKNGTNLVQNKIEAVEDRINSLSENFNETVFFKESQAKILQENLQTLLTNSTEEMKLLGDRISNIEEILTKSLSETVVFPKVSDVTECQTDGEQLGGLVIKEIVDFRDVNNQMLADLAMEIINLSEVLRETNTSIQQSIDERQAMKSFVIDIFNLVNGDKGDTSNMNAPRKFYQGLGNSVNDSAKNEILAEKARSQELPKSFNKETNSDTGELQRRLLEVRQNLDVNKNILANIKPSSVTTITLKKEVEELYNGVDMILKRLPSVGAPQNNMGKPEIESREPAKNETL